MNTTCAYDKEKHSTQQNQNLKPETYTGIILHPRGYFQLDASSNKYPLQSAIPHQIDKVSKPHWTNFLKPNGVPHIAAIKKAPAKAGASN